MFRKNIARSGESSPSAQLYRIKALTRPCCAAAARSLVLTAAEFGSVGLFTLDGSTKSLRRSHFRTLSGTSSEQPPLYALRFSSVQHHAESSDESDCRYRPSVVMSARWCSFLAADWQSADLRVRSTRPAPPAGAKCGFRLALFMGAATGRPRDREGKQERVGWVFICVLESNSCEAPAELLFLLGGQATVWI